MSDTQSLEFDVKGFAVKKYTPVAGKNDEDPGSITLSLVASKGDIMVQGSDGKLTVSDVVAALNFHQEVPLEVKLNLTFRMTPEKAQELKKIRDSAPKLALDNDD